MQDARSESNGENGRRTTPRKRREVQSGGTNKRAAKDNAKATRAARSNGPDPGEWRVNAKSALNITLYDMSGAPIRPELMKEMEEWAENVAAREKLVVSVAKG